MLEARENESMIESEIIKVKLALTRAKEVIVSSAEENGEDMNGKI